MRAKKMKELNVNDSVNSALKLEIEYLRKENQLLLKQIELNHERIKALMLRNDNLIELNNSLIERDALRSGRNDSAVERNDSAIGREASRSEKDDSAIELNDSVVPIISSHKAINKSKEFQNDSAVQFDGSGMLRDDSALQLDDSGLPLDDSAIPESGHMKPLNEGIYPQNEGGVSMKQAENKENEGEPIANEGVNWKNEGVETKKSSEMDPNDSVKMINESEVGKHSDLSDMDFKEIGTKESGEGAKDGVAINKEIVQVDNESAKLNNEGVKPSGSSPAVKKNIEAGPARFVKRLEENLKVALRKNYSKKMMKRWVTELIYFKNNKKVKSELFMQDMSISESTMIRDINMFRNKGWLEFRGIPRNGYYTLTENGVEFIEKAENEKFGE